MINWIKDRWNKESSEIGKIFHIWVARFFALCTIVGGANEWLLPLINSGFPTDFIPSWIKTVIPIAGFIAYAGGKLTIKKTDDKPSV